MTGLIAVLTTVLAPGPAAASIVTNSTVTNSDAGMSKPVLQEDKSQSLKGTLKDPDGSPISDATVTVTQNDEEIGTDTSDADGAWSIDIPESGAYTVSLDLDSIPNSMHPRSKGGEVLDDVTVRNNQARAVIFPLVPQDTPQEKPEDQETDSISGAGSDTDSESDSDAASASKKSSGTSFLDRLIQRIVLGLKLGIIIAITAIGLSLVFGTTRLINFAHGELVVVGAVSAYFFSVSPLNLPLVLATILAIGVGIALAIAMERGIWRPMRRMQTGMIQMFVVSIGISLFLRHLILVLYGSRRHQYDQYTLQESLSFGPVSLAPRDLFIMALSLIVLLGTAFMLLRTRIGKATRAVADNKDLAAASGIDVDRVILVVWIMSGGLAAFGGVMYGLTEAVYWDMGFNLLLLMFAGVILGGLGSAFGAVVGSIVIGLVAQLSTLWFPSELQNAWALLVLILVLLFRPQGILGRAERAG